MADTKRMVTIDMLEQLLQAQLDLLETVKQASGPRYAPSHHPKPLTQVEMAYRVLEDADGPLTIYEIIDRIHARFGETIQRDSLVSSLLKQVAAHRRFVKVGRSQFGLLGRDTSHVGPA